MVAVELQSGWPLIWNYMGFIDLAHYFIFYFFFQLFCFRVNRNMLQAHEDTSKDEIKMGWTGFLLVKGNLSLLQNDGPYVDQTDHGVCVMVNVINSSWTWLCYQVFKLVTSKCTLCEFLDRIGVSIWSLVMGWLFNLDRTAFGMKLLFRIYYNFLNFVSFS